MPTAAPNTGSALDQLCINTIRTLSMDAVQRADSGHPGTPMALAPLCYLLWTRHLRHNPRNPAWPGRDRFVLSCGHASMLLYSLLHLTGYDLPLDELINFRQWGSKTPGHPERGHAPGVETTTGPLGQGVGNAVGMALARAHLAAEFHRDGHEILDHRIYFLASDGDMMEGVSHEAASLAGHLKLPNLIGFYDDNRITIDGPTSLAFSDDTAKRFVAYGWAVKQVEDGNDLVALNRAIRWAQKAAAPALIVVRTHIAFGSPHKQDTAEAHGAPLGVEEVKATKQNLGWPYPEPFTVPEDALAEWRKPLRRGVRQESEWRRRFDTYAAAFPDLAGELERRLKGDLPADWEAAIPDLSKEPAVATRAASGKVINALAVKLPELVGGSADLTPSNNTSVKGAADLGPGNLGGRNLHFGVREHGMGAVLNGMALHGGVIPYGGTFLIFSDYMRPPIRLAAMMGLKVIYVFTHDSIGLGEDGPTHQPIEQLAGLRAVPNLVVIRPADAAETAEAWRTAIAYRGGPVALALTRQKVATLDRAKLGSAAGVSRGGYVLAGSGTPRAILLSCGSEVEIALKARDELEASGVTTRVVSMPSLELFARQPVEYRNQVLPPSVPCRVAVEAAQPMPWYRWVGDRGAVVGLERFGASAPYQRVYQELGITPQAVVKKVKDLVG